ncbi:MAG: DNA translocase FtsK 4TM domain-containing protein, partial [Paucibacter sp.]|nr:DNA translocase FtsK 4TM domain-containing protein [Roseateles sp.]
MSFPLGSLLGGDGAAASDKTYKRQSKKAAPAASAPASVLRSPFWLGVGALVWVLWLLAMVTHDATDAAFSIATDKIGYGNRVGALGAWVSDLCLFLFGYSSWWLLLVWLRSWLGHLADALRIDESQVQVSRWPSRALWAGGLLLLMLASTTLEWTRMYGWEARLPGGHAGGVLGYALGAWSMRVFGF